MSQYNKIINLLSDLKTANLGTSIYRDRKVIPENKFEVSISRDKMITTKKLWGLGISIWEIKSYRAHVGIMK